MTKPQLEPMVGASAPALVSRSTDGNVIAVEWEPGNCTRYRLLFTKLSSNILEVLEHNPRIGQTWWYVAWYCSSRGSYVFSPENGPLTYGYVAEKFGLHPVDASEVTRVIGTILEVPFNVTTDRHGNGAAKETTFNFGKDVAGGEL